MIFRPEPQRGEKTIAQGETLGLVSKANKPRQGRQIEAGLPPLPGLELPLPCSPDFIRGYDLAVPSGLSSEILF